MKRRYLGVAIVVSLLLGGCARGADLNFTSEAESAEPLYGEPATVVRSIGFKGAYIESYGFQEITITAQEEIQTVLDALEPGRWYGDEVPAIASGLTMVFYGEDKTIGEFGLFLNRDYRAYERMGNEPGQYKLTEQGMEDIQEVLYSKLTEETGKLEGVLVLAGPRKITPESAVLSMTVHNKRKMDYVPKEIRIEKLNGQGELEPFPEEENAIATEGFTCPGNESCEWELDLSRLTNDWPVGEYQAVIDSTTVWFYVE